MDLTFKVAEKGIILSYSFFLFFEVLEQNAKTYGHHLQSIFPLNNTGAPREKALHKLSMRADLMQGLATLQTGRSPRISKQFINPLCSCRGSI